LHLWRSKWAEGDGKGSGANTNGHERQARVHPASLSRSGRLWRSHCSRHPA